MAASRIHRHSGNITQSSTAVDEKLAHSQVTFPSRSIDMQQTDVRRPFERSVDRGRSESLCPIPVAVILSRQTR